MNYSSPLGLDIKIVPSNDYKPNVRFEYGTLTGLMRVDGLPAIGGCLIINSVHNLERGNGHFSDLMKYLYNFCRHKNISMVFEESGFKTDSSSVGGEPKRFKKYLKAIGFREFGNGSGLWKPVSKMKEGQP